MLILLAGYVISTIFADDSLESLRYLRKFWKFGLPFIVFLALRNQSEKRYLKILMYMAGLICLYGIVQYFTGIDVLRTGKFEQNLYKISNSWHAIGNFSHHLTYGGVFLIIFPVYLA
ncbi:hypothetical protein KKA14_07510, partial [bacterium]|nr:hypothetical protein [bacterium]